jgi:hypothetical protein
VYGSGGSGGGGSSSSRPSGAMSDLELSEAQRRKKVSLAEYRQRKEISPSMPNKRTALERSESYLDQSSTNETTDELGGGRKLSRLLSEIVQSSRGQNQIISSPLAAFLEYGRKQLNGEDVQRNLAVEKNKEEVEEGEVGDGEDEKVQEQSTPVKKEQNDFNSNIEIFMNGYNFLFKRHFK